MNRSQKVEWIARQLGTTSRTVYARLKRGEIKWDDFTFPADEAAGYVSPSNPAQVQTPSVGNQIAAETILKEFRDQSELVGELRERVKYLSAENNYLKQEIGLLKAPAEEPQKASENVPNLPELPKPAPLVDRIRSAWYVLVKGQGPQPQV